jgi:hypothetical protein
VLRFSRTRAAPPAGHVRHGGAERRSLLRRTFPPQPLGFRGALELAVGERVAARFGLGRLTPASQSSPMREPVDGGAETMTMVTGGTRIPAVALPGMPGM